MEERMENSNREHKRGHGMPTGMFDKNPNAHVLFIGAVNCLRHKPFSSLAARMKEGKMSLLCPTMSEFASGKYLYQITDAIKEIAEEGIREFTIVYGCQWVILSTDENIILDEFADTDIKIDFFDDSHLLYGDHE